MEFRHMTPDDYPAVVILELEVQAIHVEGAPRRHIPYGVTSLESYKAILADPANTVLLGIDDGAVVGYVHYEVIDEAQGEWRYAQRIVHIHSLTIKEEHRRKGYGEQFMDYVDNAAREQGATHVTLEVWAFNQPAYQFYERLGYVPTQIQMEKPV